MADSIDKELLVFEFQKHLTLMNRWTIIGLSVLFIASFLVPWFFPNVKSAIDEQTLGWLQGIIGTIVIFQITSGERQNNHWFPGDNK